MNKKGNIEGFKSILNLFLGISLLLMGVTQLLIIIGVLNFSFPEVPKIILEVFLGVGGFYLMIDAIMVLTIEPILSGVDLLLGLSIASLGMVPLLNDLTELLVPLPFMNEIIIYTCFVIAGILMIINSWSF